MKILPNAFYLLFYLAFKQSRTSQSTIFIHKLQGSLGVPNVTKYYLVAKMSQPSMLHATSDILLWILLETPSCYTISISALFGSLLEPLNMT